VSRKFITRANARAKVTFWAWADAVRVQLWRPTWATPVLFRLCCWELKMSTGWYVAKRRRPWRRDFFAAPYPWRPSRWAYDRYVGGMGHECRVWRWGWFSLHWLGPKAKRK
jgi:hypothetical protein